MSDSKLFSFISSCPKSIKNIIASYLSCIDILGETTIKEEYKIFFDKNITKELYRCKISEKIEYLYNLYYEKLIIDLLITIEQQFQTEVTFYTINFGQKLFSRVSKAEALIARITKEKDGKIQQFLQDHITYGLIETLVQVKGKIIPGFYRSQELNYKSVSLSIYTFLSTLLLKVYPLKSKIYQQISGSENNKKIILSTTTNNNSSSFLFLN